jgi:hypothetical protein
MITMSHNWHQHLDVNMRERLSVADAVELVHRLGLTKVAIFISVVFPWSYQPDNAHVSLYVQSFVQNVVAQAAHAGKTLIKFTYTSISDFLLSPLLIERAIGILLFSSRRQRSIPTSRAVITAAATVARKPCSPSIDLPVDKGVLPPSI